MIPAQQVMETGLLSDSRMSPFRDRIREGVDLSRTNWFRVGGPAQYLFKPDDAEDLAAFLKVLPPDVPVTILGVGSNVIVRDGGIDGVVIRLGRGFAGIAVNGDRVEAGAGALSLNVALVACDHGIAGLEFLSGIPGTIGGAVKMNAGAYGSDTSQVVIEAEIVTRDGQIQTLTNSQIKFAYRHSSLPEGAIVIRAAFQGKPGRKDDIAAQIQFIGSAREETQPIRSRTGGSTFKNPEGYKAWELIEKAGCRGLTIGGAQMSEKHCNFMINTGTATAADLEALGEEVIRRVREQCDVTLEWEIRRIGKR